VEISSITHRSDIVRIPGFLTGTGISDRDHAEPGEKTGRVFLKPDVRLFLK
jgi:hypothetical protein